MVMRTVTSHCNPLRIATGSVDSSTATPALAIRTVDWSVGTDVGVGDTNLTLVNVAPISPLASFVFAGPDGTNRYCSGQALSATSIKVRGFNSAGSGNDSVVNALHVLSQRTPFQRQMAAPVQTFCSGARIAWATYNADGTAAVNGSSFVVSKTGTGTYTINFRPAFGQTPEILVQAVGTTVRDAYLVTESASSCTIETRVVGGALVDNAFTIVVLGSDRVGWATKSAGRSLKATSIAPRMEVCQIALGGGSLSGNPALGTSSSGTTGRYTLTLAGKPYEFRAGAFVRPFCAIACTASGAANRAQVRVIPTDGITVTVDIYNGAGSATDDVVNILLLGNDFKEEGGGY